MILRSADSDAVQTHARPTVIRGFANRSRVFDDGAVVVAGAFGTLSETEGIRRRTAR
jgi:hypothetical protein